MQVVSLDWSSSTKSCITPRCFFGEVEGTFSGSISKRFTCCSRDRLLPQIYSVEVIGSSDSDSIAFYSTLDIRSPVNAKVVSPLVFFRLFTSNVQVSGSFENLAGVSIQCVLVSSEKRFIFEASLFNTSMIIRFDVFVPIDPSISFGLQDNFGQQVSLFESIITQMQHPLTISSVEPSL